MSVNRMNKVNPAIKVLRTKIYVVALAKLVNPNGAAQLDSVVFKLPR